MTTTQQRRLEYRALFKQNVEKRLVVDKTVRAEALQAQLDSWLSSPPVVLTMKSIYSTMGGSTGKKVIVQPFPFKPYRYTAGPKDQEYLVADIQLLEVV